LNTLACVKRSKVPHTNIINVNAVGKFGYNNLLICCFKNGRIFQKFRSNTNDRLAFIFTNYLWVISKMKLYRANVRCKMFLV
jgi:hypothetical protein